MDRALVISKLIDYYKLSRNVDFANFFGVSEQNAYGWKRGAYNVYEVYRRCPDIDPEWLLSDGEVGEMLREKNEVKGGMSQDCRQLLEKSLDNTQHALERLAQEQAISKSVLAQTDKVIELIRSVKD